MSRPTDKQSYGMQQTQMLNRVKGAVYGAGENETTKLLPVVEVETPYDDNYHRPGMPLGWKITYCGVLLAGIVGTGLIFTAWVVKNLNAPLLSEDTEQPLPDNQRPTTTSAPSTYSQTRTPSSTIESTTSTTSTSTTQPATAISVVPLITLPPVVETIIAPTTTSSTTTTLPGEQTSNTTMYVDPTTTTSSTQP